MFPGHLQLFVAKVLKSSPDEDVQQLFSHYGAVEKVSMFKPAPDAVFHKASHRRRCCPRCCSVAAAALYAVPALVNLHPLCL